MDKTGGSISISDTIQKKSGLRYSFTEFIGSFTEYILQSQYCTSQIFNESFSLWLNLFNHTILCAWRRDVVGWRSQKHILGENYDKLKFRTGMGLLDNFVVDLRLAPWTADFLVNIISVTSFSLFLNRLNKIWFLIKYKALIIHI